MKRPTADEVISANRLRKATLLAQALRKAGATAYTLTVMQETQWVAAARAAQVSLASNATKTLVQELFAQGVRR